MFENVNFADFPCFRFSERKRCEHMWKALKVTTLTQWNSLRNINNNAGRISPRCQSSARRYDKYRGVQWASFHRQDWHRTVDWPQPRHCRGKPIYISLEKSRRCFIDVCASYYSSLYCPSTPFPKAKNLSKLLKKIVQ